jgi:hypothetical protein
MKKTLIIISFIVLSCTNNKKVELDLEIKLLTKKLVVGKEHNGINILTYSITNNSGNIFYINNYPGTLKTPLSISKNRRFLRIFEDNKECIYYPIFIKPSETNSNCNAIENEEKEIEAKNLGYKESSIFNLLDLDKVNFFIYPKQTLFFEYYTSIDKYKSESKQSSIVSIDYNSKRNYYATLSIASDSTNYKNILPRNILKTIETNNVKIYHGIIESNKVPIIILK